MDLRDYRSKAVEQIVPYTDEEKDLIKARRERKRRERWAKRGWIQLELGYEKPPDDR